MIIAVCILASLSLLSWLYLHHPKFGKAPSGPRMERMERSPHFKAGAFDNISPTPALTEGASYYGVMKEFFFGRSKSIKPPSALPSVKTDLKALRPEEDVLVWFGHSSYFLQLDGKRMLVDPVFSGSASPVAFTTRSFPGSDVYTADDMPDLDYLLLTHDHYDHMDYKTVLALKPKVNRVITSLGVGAHLEHWGYGAEGILELDWNEQLVLPDGFSLHAVTARHFSGRGFKRNGTLWSSFVLQTPRRKLFIGGDSGYDKHFAAIGDQHGPFDLAILENGQYGRNWKYIHMMPEEVVQAAIDLKAKRLLPVHWAKFALAMHDWDEPIKRVVAEATKRELPLLHPMIGEAVPLDADGPSAAWWETVR